MAEEIKMKLDETQMRHLVAAILAVSLAGGAPLKAEKAVANYKQVRQLLKSQGLSAAI